MAPDEDDWQAASNARMVAIEHVLGKPDDMVYHAILPFDLGGQADVALFHHYVPGNTYVTVDLIGRPEQSPNDLGRAYELMMCTRESSDWAASLLSRLAPYTCDVALNPGETMDIEAAIPPGSTTTALLFTEPDLPFPMPDVLGVKTMLLLCIGITTDELAECQAGGSANLLARLRRDGVFPYTDLTRNSV